MLFDMVPAIMTTIIISLAVTQSRSGDINRPAFLFSLIVFCVTGYIWCNYLPYSFQGGIVVLYICFPIIIPVFSIRGVLIKQRFYTTLFLFGLINSLCTMSDWIVRIIISVEIPSTPIDFAVMALLLVALLLTKRRSLISQLFHNIKRLSIILKMILLCAMLLNTLVSSLSATLYTDYWYLPGFSFVGVLIILLILLVGIMCPLLITNNLSRAYYQSLSQILDKQFQTQITHYEAMAKANADVRKFKHDYDNLKVGLIDLIKRGDIPDAMILLESDDKSDAREWYSFNTGSPILDALLVEKQTRAASLSATIVFAGVVPGNLVKPVDICAIFGNALDNALEACSKCAGKAPKTILVQADFKHGFLFINITNPTSAAVTIINNAVVTTKENANTHGIGLFSIKTSVDKYSGAMRLSYGESEFCLDIELDLNPLLSEGL